MNPDDRTGDTPAAPATAAYAQPQRWLLLAEEPDAAARLAAAVAHTASPLARLRLDHGLVSIVGRQDLGAAAANALGTGEQALRIHGVADPGTVRAALRPLLDGQQALRVQYVLGGDAGLQALLAELQSPDAAVLIGWWHSRGTIVPRLGPAGAGPDFADAAARAFESWADVSGARDSLRELVESGENEPDDGDESPLQPADTDDDADNIRPFELRPLPGAGTAEVPPVWSTLKDWRQPRPLAASGDWMLVLSRPLPAGKGPTAATTADLVEVFQPPDAGPWSDDIEVRFRVRLRPDRWRGRRGLRLEVHLPHRLAIVVPLDSHLLQPEKICRLGPDRRPVNDEGWQRARFVLRAAPRPGLG